MICGRNLMNEQNLKLLQLPAATGAAILIWPRISLSWIKEDDSNIHCDTLLKFDSPKKRKSRSTLHSIVTTPKSFPIPSGPTLALRLVTDSTAALFLYYADRYIQVLSHEGRSLMQLTDLKYSYSVMHGSLIVITDHMVHVIPLTSEPVCYQFPIAIDENASIIPVLSQPNTISLAVRTEPSYLVIYEEGSGNPIFESNSITNMTVISPKRALEPEFNLSYELYGNAVIELMHTMLPTAILTNCSLDKSSISISEANILKSVNPEYLALSILHYKLSRSEFQADDVLSMFHSANCEDEISNYTEICCKTCGGSFCGLACTSMSITSLDQTPAEFNELQWTEFTPYDSTFAEITSLGLLSALKKLSLNRASDHDRKFLKYAYHCKWRIPQHIAKTLNPHLQCGLKRKEVYFLCGRLDLLFTLNCWRLSSTSTVTPRSAMSKPDHGIAKNYIHLVSENSDSLIALLGCAISEAYYKTESHIYHELKPKSLRWGAIGSGNALLVWQDFYWGRSCGTQYNDIICQDFPNASQSEFRRNQFNKLINDFLNSQSIANDIETVLGNSMPVISLVEKLLVGPHPVQITPLGLWVLLREMYFISGLILTANISHILDTVLQKVHSLLKTVLSVNKENYKKLMLLGSGNQLLFSCIDVIIDHSADNSWYSETIDMKKSPALNHLLHSLLLSLIRTKKPKSLSHDLVNFFLACVYSNEPHERNWHHPDIIARLNDIHNLAGLRTSDAFLLFGASILALEFPATPVKYSFTHVLSERLLQELWNLMQDVSNASADNYLLETHGRIPTANDEYLSEDIVWFRHLHNYTNPNVVRRAILLAAGIANLESEQHMKKLIYLWKKDLTYPELTDSLTEQPVMEIETPVLRAGGDSDYSLLTDPGFAIGVAIGRTNGSLAEANGDWLLEDLHRLPFESFTVRLFAFFMLNELYDGSNLMSYMKEMLNKLPRWLRQSASPDLVTPLSSLSDPESSLDEHDLYRRELSALGLACIDAFNYHILVHCIILLAAAASRLKKGDIELIQEVLKLLSMIQQLPLPSMFVKVKTTDSASMELMRLFTASSRTDSTVLVLDASVRNLCLMLCVNSLSLVSAGSRDPLIGTTLDSLLETVYTQLPCIIPHSDSNVNSSECYSYKLFYSILLASKTLHSSRQDVLRSGTLLTILSVVFSMISEIGDNSNSIFDTFATSDPEKVNYLVVKSDRETIKFCRAHPNVVSIENKTEKKFLHHGNFHLTENGNDTNCCSKTTLQNRKDQYIIHGNNVYENIELHGGLSGPLVVIEKNPPSAYMNV